MGVQPMYNHFNKTLLFFDCKSNSLYRQKDYMTDDSFIRSVPVLHTQNAVPTLSFLRWLVPPSPPKFVLYMTSDFDVCEIDPDIQMSFFNAA